MLDNRLDIKIEKATIDMMKKVVMTNNIGMQADTMVAMRHTILSGRDGKS